MTPSSLLVASSPLDDFLEGSSSSTESGELLQQIGLFGSLFGVTLATGLLVFLAVSHSGTQREVSAILRLVAIAGGAAALGAAIELAGVASIGSLSWYDALTDSTGSAPMMRLLAGVSIVFGVFDHTVPVEGERDDAEESQDAADPQVRWIAASPSAFGLVGVVVGVISFWFDGHTVTEGPRVLHAVVNTTHVSAGSIWFGGVVGLIALAILRRSIGGSIAPDIIRFSAVATVALVLVGLAGSVMALFVIEEFGDLTSTDWGRLLLVKVGAVAIAASIGGYNHFVVVPALERSVDDAAITGRARVTLTVEAVVLAFVVALTVLLTTASIN